MKSIKEWTKKQKIIAGSAAGAVLALAVVLGVWQPWRAQEPERDPAPQPPRQEEPEQPEEEKLTLTVGLEEIPCVIYEGDGWSVYVPETWTVDADGNGGVFTDPASEARMEVVREAPAQYIGTFLFASREALSENEDWLLRRFYTGDLLSGAWAVTCQAPEEAWEDQEKLLTALARTFTAGEARPFDGLYPVASEPSWQTVDGDVVLWLDKDGYPVEADAEEFVEAEMLAWPSETKALFTGQYRLDDLRWSGSYTCIGEGYIDIFTATVWYEAAEDGDMPDIIKWDRVWKDGWVQDRDRVAVVLCHDGGEVTEKLTLWFFDEVPGEAAPASWLAGELGIDTNTPLTAEELTALEDHFNDREYNDLLRFPYDDASQAADYLSVLFYDLGEDESTLTEEEKAALEEAGVPLDLDVFRLKRDYVETYLRENLWLALSNLEPLADPPGTYLEAFDAWYQSHGDTAMQTYVFDSGTVALDGTVTLSYTAPYLDIRGEAGELEGAFDVAESAMKKKERAAARAARGETTATNRIARQVEEMTGFETRVCVPGHMLRGGSPSAYDRVLATQFGVHAAKLVEADHYGVAVAMRNNIVTTNPLKDVAGKTKFVPETCDMLTVARRMGISLG